MILVISYPGEEHTADVVQRLEQQGCECVSIDLSDFPAKKGVALTWSSDQDPAYLIETATGPVDLSRIQVAWWRRVRPFAVDEAVNATMRPFVLSETGQAVNGMMDAMDCRWVNPRRADDAAHHKPYQWSVASRVGLKLPRTLVTNQPEAAQAFIESIGVGKTIFKAFLASFEDWRETRLIEKEDMDRLDLVRFAPVIFQEYIEGVDLRITIIGNQVFAAEIDARHTSYPVDMRMVVGESVVKPVDLPMRVRQQLLALQRTLGIDYGAIDMRRTAAGDYYFLEVNPAGQWLFVEQYTGLPISQAMADYLVAIDRSVVPNQLVHEISRG
ncbi:MvdC/MvdD family ATP grasp protein [Spirosoma pollinicola]|uniref:Alpha-L-glutamate ligase n=1 Tax=Spirosoma pollinicola TaxID=2057025 RepID=A0A2K8YYX3_9BACT|nr:alpha-L-glutamate ligase [Spirosoma pollinicola]AUD02811.1 alpha-L-glutamate ligase [Spirosoma pollinicola]